ncbi:hypothetical protein [Shinella granuli]|jgi:branched-subunit amino acid ABC-type transport system permease component|uniref:Uncharacterized protein n=1 Tax=Shinella granuli TaxID=323621 RepID=A0A4R2D2H2_SHIGR|nr:hypothetical protein [Shinella granuli]TCN48051.1 hypothetical protein EV665_102580 [Shinella granuli]
MKPGALMMLGAFAAFVAIAASLLGRADGGIAVLIFAGGAVFGKGYGVWEERGSRSALSKETRE